MDGDQMGPGSDQSKMGETNFWIEFTIWLNPRMLTIELLLDLTPKSDTQVWLKLLNCSIFAM